MSNRTEEQAIRDVNTTWIDAVNSGDLDCLFTLMTDDVVFLNPGEAPLGRGGFPAKFLGGHQQFHLRCTSELEEMVVVGDVAYTRAFDTVTVTPRTGGEESRFAGRRLTVWRKQPDGRWLLARDACLLLPVAK